MNGSWEDVAERIAAGVEVPAGGLVIVRDRCGRPEVVEAVVIAFERQGVTVFVEAVNDRVLRAVLPETPEELLAGWGRHRAAVLELANAVVSLGAGTPSLEGVSETAAAAFRQGRAVMEEVEARRALPFIFVAIPTAGLADELATSMTMLDASVRAAMATPLAALQAAIHTQLARAVGDPLTLQTRDCTLTLQRAQRPWLHDDGHISGEDRASGAVASTLPCGSIYTTVIEESVHGTVRLPRLAGAHDVVPRASRA